MVHDLPRPEAELLTGPTVWLRSAMEAVVLICVAVSPWAFGAADPIFELALHAAVALLLVLWGAIMGIEGRFTWRMCPVALCLAALFMLGAVQLIPLPRAVLETMSPATAALYDRFLPAELEELPADEGPPRETVPTGTTLSVYPAASRQVLIRILAVFCLFAVVRNNLTSMPALRRLSLVATINGAALALFGLVQSLTAPPQTLYWQFAAPGQVFGPFVCRTHFAFYINLCFGLGLGLIFMSQPGPARAGRTHLVRPAVRPVSLLAFLQEPRVLWVGVALILMLAGVLFSLARGGVVALGAACVLVLAVRLSRVFTMANLAAIVLVLAGAAGLVFWFGAERLEARLATLWKGEALQESRTALWSSAWRIAREFPVAGTGNGTFQYVEPLHRHADRASVVVADHAHNEYLEAWVEGGLGRLAVGMLALGLLLRSAFWAVRRHPESQAAGLALGALFALASAAVHSIGDFALHLPAVAFLLTVLSAHVIALGEAGPPTKTSDQSVPFASVYRLSRPAALVVAVMAASLGLLLVAEGWRTTQVEQLRFAAFRLKGAKDPAARERRLAYLGEASRRMPESAWLHAELGEALLDTYERKVEASSTRARAHEAADLVVAYYSSHEAAAVRALAFHVAATVVLDELNQDEEARWARQHVIPGLRSVLRARDLCPLLGRPQFLLAAHGGALARADGRFAYLDRAKALLPSDPGVWYVSGLQELLDNRPDSARVSWQHALGLSAEYLNVLLDAGASNPTAAEIVSQMLPDNPAILFEAATRLYPRSEQAAARRALLERALAFLDRSSPLAATEFRLRAVVCHALGRSTESVAAYKDALRRTPDKFEWQYELASMLTEQGMLPEARKELLLLLGRQPGHGPARELLNAVSRAEAKP